MTPEQAEQRRLILEAKAAKDEACIEAKRLVEGPKLRYKLVMAAHKHSWVPNEPGRSNAPKCEICDKVLYSRWYCPDSPTHLCSYRKHGEDECDYCGHPEERN